MDDYLRPISRHSRSGERRREQRIPTTAVTSPSQMNRNILPTMLSEKRQTGIVDRRDMHSVGQTLVVQSECEACDSIRAYNALLIVNSKEQRRATFVGWQGGDDPCAPKGVSKEPFFHCARGGDRCSQS